MSRRTPIVTLSPNGPHISPARSVFRYCFPNLLNSFYKNILSTLFYKRFDMTPLLPVSEKTYRSLTELGQGLFNETEVLDRLVSNAVAKQPLTPESPAASISDVPDPVQKPSSPVQSQNQGLPGRFPRQRGIAIAIGTHRIFGESVSDLYEQVLRHLVDSKLISELMPHIPFGISSRRYLISRTPKHPAGHDFVIPVNYGGFYMEAHKSYQNAISGLNKMLSRANIELVYPA